ncbi:MAG: hypothetical protein NTW65_10520 [Deltaproteobacteria bacterium]|nr:hypothetical protein [Deltaproteobacteria bacterium]
MITADVKFIRKYLYSMGEKYSKFRGRGRIVFAGDSITVAGKRIYDKMILRGALILFATLLLILIIKVNILFWFVVLISYYLMQYVLLKKEELTLTWSQINKYEVDAKNKLISFAIEKKPECSPIIFRTEQFDQITDIFRENIRDRERTSRGWKALEQNYDEQANSMSKTIDRWLGNKP